MPTRADIAIIGAGAAGLMAAICAGRAAQHTGTPLRIIALDGARSLGAKILVSGGGRCNVTHHRVDEAAYAGSTPPSIRKVLRAFPVERTITFFAELGITLKREDTGKLFPTTDSARTVLDALLAAARDASIDLIHPWKVGAIERTPEGFTLARADDPADTITAARIILCAGGKSLPKSGSDGSSHTLARSLGHSIAQPVIPALVPLVLGPEHAALLELTGLATPAELEVRAATGKRLARITGSTLITHFGLSGPAPMDISRHLIIARAADPGSHLIINWLPQMTAEDLEARLLHLGPRTPESFLRDHLPARLASTLCALAAIDPATTGAKLTRDARRALTRTIREMRIESAEARGWNYAEVTAGGVPLAELDLATMESRITPGLHMAGEVCDVDGRIGGFNFQWAWASGFLAGTAAASMLPRPGGGAGSTRSVETEGANGDSANHAQGRA